MADQYAAIMQPYVFPYIGYFHLIQASSTFVFYDDVHYIKDGWINRNRILNQDTDLLFTIPVSKASSFKLINEIAPVITAKWKKKFHKQLTQNYKKALYFNDTIEVIMSPFSKEYTDITDLAIESILSVYSYLGIQFTFAKSSVCSPDTKGLEKADRIIEITKKLGFVNYVNPAGGKHLYSKDYFHSKGINLSFLKSYPVEYRQHHETFVPWLSIIDVLMFCGRSKTIELMSSYTLE